MKLTPFVIEHFARWVSGGAPFYAMREIVATLESDDLPGSEKRDKALDQFKQLGYSLAKWVANLLLELAVAYVRGKAV